jgi:antitoxin (DNA-binding transcriptional repressor) of toxin-antitoxin stability system
MTGVKFATVSNLDRKATAFVAEVEKGQIKIAITKNGRPVALLERASGTEAGRKETVSALKNEAARIISELVKTGKRVIITRDTEPVALLQKITDTVFSIEK